MAPLSSSFHTDITWSQSLSSLSDKLYLWWWTWWHWLCAFVCFGSGLKYLILSNKAWQVYTKHPSQLGREEGDVVDDEEVNKVGGVVSRLVRLQNPGDEMWGVPQGKSQAIWFPIRNILIPLPRYLILCLDQKGQRGNKSKQTNALYLLPIFVAFVKNLAHFGHQFRFMQTIYFVFNPN